MANEALRTVLQHLRRAADFKGTGKPTDAELLERFVVARDQAAFEVLVWRHGPMVLNLCRRLLRHEYDAEDAFQATFLALVRKAGSITKREAVASWLYKVAYRVALEANARRVKHAECEIAGVETLAAKPTQDMAGREIQMALSEEVNRLPDKYRVPLVLHCFDGKTSQEVAVQLGCTEATVRTRLARARQRLHTRLVRRGLALSAGMFAARLSPSAVSTAFVDSTVKAATQFAACNVSVVAANAAVLAERVLKLMFLNKLKQLASVVVFASVISAGAGLSIHQALAGKPQAQDNQDASKRVTNEARQSRDDRTDIRGTWVKWETITRSTNRETFPPEQVKVTYVITDDKMMQVGEDGFLDGETTLEVNPTQSPKAINTFDRRTGTLLRGIYQLEGDTLKIAYGQGKRPTEFPAKPAIFTRVSRTFAPVAQRFANAPGCYWIDEPRGNPVNVFLGLSGVGMNYLYDKEPDGAAVITMAYLTPDAQAREYRPVLVDAGRRRYLPKRVVGGYAGRRGEGLVVLHRWRMDPNVLPAGNVAGLGIEAVTPESRSLRVKH